ncbi:unnamed protein product [Brassica rapa]|uniref:Uncharacterized protein n=1 Tax=Brassica campestris TaxID=3711 RepID=A0A8D9I2R3_BRACM|nr:unnamed protein product [Brassica rapa]
MNGSLWWSAYDLDSSQICSLVLLLGSFQIIPKIRRRDPYHCYCASWTAISRVLVYLLPFIPFGLVFPIVRCFLFHVKALAVAAEPSFSISAAGLVGFQAQLFNHSRI